MGGKRGGGRGIVEEGLWTSVLGGERGEKEKTRVMSRRAFSSRREGGSACAACDVKKEKKGGRGLPVRLATALRSLQIGDPRAERGNDRPVPETAKGDCLRRSSRKEEKKRKGGGGRVPDTILYSAEERSEGLIDGGKGREEGTQRLRSITSNEGRKKRGV